MNSIPLAHQVLLQILKEEMPFNLAVKSAFKKNDINNLEKHDVSAIVGCVLRHYYVFDVVIENEFADIILDSRIALMICLANSLFVKKFDENETIEFARTILKYEKVDTIKEFLTPYIEGKNLIPEKFFPHSYEFLSLRFNTPVWLVKMWKKHYGQHLSEKILKANSKAAISYCRLNYGVEKQDILSSSEFTDVPNYKDIVNYVGKGRIKNNDDYKNCRIFPTKLPINYIFDKLDLDPTRGIAYFSGFANTYFLELAARFGNDITFELIAGQPQAFFDARRALNQYKMNNVRLYEEKSSSIIACLSSQYHTFFVLPLNSNFSLLRNTPDYFLRFKQENLDELIKGELETLNEAAPYVEVGGDLVYIIPTVSYKESHQVVEDFLLANNGFTLIEEKQFLPCDDFDSSLYYAIIRRSIMND